MRDTYKLYPFTLDSFYKIFGKPRTDIDSVKYIYDYLKKYQKEKEIENISILEEIAYVEKFYLRDYSRFYAEAFTQFSRFTRRIHFFSNKLTYNKIEKVINSGKKEQIYNLIRDSYLGYTIVKPVKDEGGSSLIGRSVLPVYPKDASDGTRHYLSIDNKAQLFGIDLNVESIPFHEQDIAVGACASACLWMAQFIIKKWYDIPIISLAEITELSRLKSPYTAPCPIYPSEGLTLSEISNYIEHLNIHFHKVDNHDILFTLKNLVNLGISGLNANNLIEDLIKSYFHVGFPLICGLQFYEGSTRTDLHATLITGYKEDRNGNILELYVHDDQIGPYCYTKLDTSIKKWKNEWFQDPTISKIELEDIIIPVDPLVKLRFLDFCIYYYDIKSQADAQGFKSEARLYHINDYKKEILTKEINLYIDEDGKHFSINQNPKLRFLSKNMPRYFWVARVLDNHSWVVDSICDANSTLVRDPIAELYFN